MFKAAKMLLGAALVVAVTGGNQVRAASIGLEWGLDPTLLDFERLTQSFGTGPALTKFHANTNIYRLFGAQYLSGNAGFRLQREVVV